MLRNILPVSTDWSFSVFTVSTSGVGFWGNNWEALAVEEELVGVGLSKRSDTGSKNGDCSQVVALWSVIYKKYAWIEQINNNNQKLKYF